MSRAAYMREYRAKRKAPKPIVSATEESGMLIWDCPACGQRVSSMRIPGADGRQRIADLEEEVARLKRELALRPTLANPMTERGELIRRQIAAPDRWTPEFRPVPKVKPKR